MHDVQLQPRRGVEQHRALPVVDPPERLFDPQGSIHWHRRLTIANLGW